MFLLGVLFQRNAEVLQAWVERRFAAVLIGYVVLATLAVQVFGWSVGNTIHPILFAGLAIVTFAGAFTAPGLSDRLLSRNDLSYGVYIYHAPVMNLLIALAVAGSPLSFWLALAATFVLAFLSWRFVEKPALDFKRHPLYRHRGGVA
jgi:peptidoglycan/LPS O-acetylase OafA/YrhL